MKFALLQLDLKAGDIANNAKVIYEAAIRAAEAGAEICITPELALIGYDANDNLLYPAFLNFAENELNNLAIKLANKNIALIAGCVRHDGARLVNSLAFIASGEIIAFYDKRNLEARDIPYFEEGKENRIVQWKSRYFALAMGSDFEHYACCPDRAIDHLIVCAANPYIIEAQDRARIRLAAIARKKLACNVFYVNAVGACGDAIFPGCSLWISRVGIPVTRAAKFAPDILVIDLDYPQDYVNLTYTDQEDEIFAALCLGLGSYCQKSGFGKIVMEFSNDANSALAAAIAREAMGAENVIGLAMPGPVPGPDKTEAIREPANALGIKTYVTPLDPVLNTLEALLASSFADLQCIGMDGNNPDNIRGAVLLAFADRLNALPLSTLDKTDLLCGGRPGVKGLHVLGDLYKSEVFSLCRWHNKQFDGLFISRTHADPHSSVDAFLHECGLRSYSELDNILKKMLDERMDVAKLEACGFALESVLKVARLVSSNRPNPMERASIMRLRKRLPLNVPATALFPLTLASGRIYEKAKPARPCEEPYLSVVMVSRNDDHGGNPLQRTQMFIDSLAWQAECYSLPLELVVVDWNPPAGRPGLESALRYPANPWFTARIITVPPELHRGYRHSDRQALFQMIGKNVGIRRARGEYILATNIDILLDDSLMEAIASRCLEPDRLYRADRYDVVNSLPAGDHMIQQQFCRQTSNHVRRNYRAKPQEFSQLLETDPFSSQALAESDKILRYFDIDLDTWPLCTLKSRNDTSLLSTNACGDFTLLHRDAWFRLHGYAEFEAFSMQIDSIGVICAYLAGYRETSFLPPLVSYHIEHSAGSGWTPEHANAIYERVVGIGLPFIECGMAESHLLPRLKKDDGWIMNDGRWGLANAKLKETIMEPDGQMTVIEGEPYVSDGLPLSALLYIYDPAVMFQDWRQTQEDNWQRKYGLNFKGYEKILKEISPEYLVWGLQLAKRAELSRMDIVSDAKK